MWLGNAFVPIWYGFGWDLVVTLQRIGIGVGWTWFGKGRVLFM